MADRNYAIQPTLPRMQLKSALALNFVLGLLVSVSAQDTSLSDVKQAFDDANIPANLAINFKPEILLQVGFPQPSGEDIILAAGVKLPRSATVGPPSFGITEHTIEHRGPLVIASVDPDAPTPENPTSAQIRHFLGGNFFTYERSAGGSLWNATAAITNFVQPTPPAGSNAHRYIFLVFKEPEGFNEQTIVTPTTPIAKFNISQFTAQVGLGDPIGGTFMLVAPEA